MVKTKHITIGAAVLVAGIIAFFIFSQREEAKVKRQFKFIARKTEKTPEESQIVAATKANRIREVCTETCNIHAPAYSFSEDISSDELSSLFLTNRSQYLEISMKWSSPQKVDTKLSYIFELFILIWR